MKILTFAEINDLENGSPIPSLTGKVERMFDQRTGEGQYGIWWLQSFTLIDEHANEITCTWTGEDTVNELQGKTILIESTFNKKEQLVGIKKEIKNKNGKRYESVKLDDRCKISRYTFTGTFQPVNGGDATSKPTPESLTSSAAPTSHPESAALTDGVTEAKRHLVQSANLYNLCVDAVRTMVESHAAHFWPDGLGGEMFRTAVSSLYIESSSRRCTDGVTWWSYLEKMPTKPL
jgi:hypothetical protein